MKPRYLFRPAALCFLLALPVIAATPPDVWQKGVPFSFKYAGRESAQFLSSWSHADETVTADGGKILRRTYSDPVTKLRVIAEIRTFNDFAAVEWLLKFRNEGTSDSPIIEDIMPLDWAFAAEGNAALHHARGSTAQPNDYAPQTEVLKPGSVVHLQSESGRSSSGNTLPFFNLELGDHGVIGAIGWTGNWDATFSFAPSAKIIAAKAGMRKTHFLLHPQEEIRSPRILLLDWTGGNGETAQNTWRRLILAYYSASFAADPGPADAHNPAWLAWLTQVLQEYREVQPYFYGDFYPLLPYTLEKNAWTAWQWHVPQRNSGIVLLLRRPEALFTSMHLNLHAVDSDAIYEVETRTGLAKAPLQIMTGHTLKHLPITLPEKPSSVLLFYRRRT